MAQIHLDYLQRPYRSNYELIGEKGLILWDYISQNVELFSKITNQKEVFQESINTNREIMFINEMKYFIQCIEGKASSMNGVSNARDILEMALACRLSAKKKEIVYL